MRIAQWFLVKFLCQKGKNNFLGEHYVGKSILNIFNNQPTLKGGKVSTS